MDAEEALDNTTIFTKNSQQTRKRRECSQLVKGHLRKTYSQPHT